MALSSSESTLLNQTCENMNIAANTCREVLEMLRNLGNTGVVDIATHNNTPGAHANDNTLFHVTNGSNFKRYIFDSGVGVTPVRYMDYWDGYIIDTTEVKTLGHTSQLGGRITIKESVFTTDENGDNLSFDDYNVSDLLCYTMHLYELKDNTGTQNIASSGFRYFANRESIFGDTGTGIKPYSQIAFMVTQGVYGAVNNIVNIAYPSFFPAANNTISLGWSGRAFKDLFVVSSPTVTSDRRAKKDVSALGSQAVDFIKALRPVSYRLVQGEGHIDPVDIDGNPVPVENPPVDREGIRTHWGLIAQEVKEALSTAGYEDAALWCLADKNDPDSQQALRYEELIAPMIKVIQQQQERIEALERKVA